MSGALPSPGVAVARGRRPEGGLRAPRLPARLRDFGPALSVGAAVVLSALVQALGPAARAAPAGQARFDLAGAWAALAPGALGGAPVSAPTAGGWLQLGLLQRLLRGIGAQSVVAATDAAMTLTAVISVALLWVLLRRQGAGLLAAAVAAAGFGIAPEAVEVHASASASNLAVVWLLLAAVLATRRRGAAAPVLAGVACGLAVLASPLSLVLVPLVALLEGAPPRRAVRAVEDPVERPTARLVLAAAAFAVVLVGAALTTLVLVLVPEVAAGRTLAALGAASPGAGVGVAALAAWATRDPLSLLVAAVAVAAAVRIRRAVGTAALLLALLSLWPAGHDAIAPAALLLPVVAVAVGLATDAAIAALGNRLFRVSVTGAGWLMGVAALLVVSLAIWAGSLAARPAGGDAVAQAGHWIDRGVPAGQTVLVPLAAWPDLSAGARAQVGWYAVTGSGVPSAPSWTSTDWILADGSVRGAASGSAAAVLARGRTVTRFGTGPQQLSVLAVPATSHATGSAPGGVAAPAPSVSPSVLASRRAAGIELAANPALTLDSTGRALLAAGQVDARLSIAVGQLLSGHELTVVGFPAVAGEAGVRRQVLIGAVDGRRVPADATAAGVVLRYFSALRGDYAIQRIDSDSAGILITFPADSGFVPSS